MVNKWKEVVSAVAPTIATALGGPLSGAATASLLKVFGVTSDVELEEALKTATPEQLTAIKALDLEYQKLLAANTKSARDLQGIALQQSDTLSKRFIYVFTAAWSIFAIAYIAAITFINIPADNVRYVDTILGFLLGTIIATMIQYFFGSSMGSKLKDERK
jgi:hypothetical protein